MSKIGTADIKGIMLGSTEIVKAYLGSDVVFQNVVPPPAGFEWCEYIQNTSTSYIDTGINIRTIVTANLKMSAPSKGSGNNVMYGLYSNNTISCQLYVNSSTKFTVSPNTHVVGATNGEKFVFDKIYDLAINNIKAASSNLTLYIFARNNSSRLPFNGMRLYSCTMVTGGETVRNFRPAYRIADEKYGLYDTINNQFYLSPNGVDFAGG
jgi:hypothetical protein